MDTCYNCGARLTPSARFCAACGAPADSEQTRVSTEATRFASEETRVAQPRPRAVEPLPVRPPSTRRKTPAPRARRQRLATPHSTHSRSQLPRPRTARPYKSRLHSPRLSSSYAPRPPRLAPTPMRNRVVCLPNCKRRHARASSRRALHQARPPPARRAARFRFRARGTKRCRRGVRRSDSPPETLRAGARA